MQDSLDRQGKFWYALGSEREVERMRDRLKYGSKGDWCRHCYGPVPGPQRCAEYRVRVGHGHEAFDRAVLRRCRVEERIARATVRALLAAGYELSVDNGEEETKPSRDFAKVAGAMFETDEDYLCIQNAAGVEAGGRKLWAGWVRFVYGNDGLDVICDYTVNLEAVLAPVLEMAEGMERGDS
jgi:hypothetical protein